MSNRRKSEEDEILEEFERMLSEGGFDSFELESDEEEDFGFYHPSSSSRFNPDYDSDYDIEEPPPVPEESKKPKCEHKNKRKAGLTTAFWYCPDCKEEV